MKKNIKNKSCSELTQIICKHQYGSEMRDHIRNYAKITAPIKRSTAPIQWTPLLDSHWSLLKRDVHFNLSMFL